MCAEVYGRSIYSSGLSINSWISSNFRYWEKRENYTSFSELREQLGFPINEDGYGKASILAGHKIDLNQYVLFCEMILNLVIGLYQKRSSEIERVVVDLIDTVKATISKAGLIIDNRDDIIRIIEKNAVTIEVADKVPDIANVIIEYNHYLLRGNIERKKELLKSMADALDPFRKKLEGLQKRNTSDFFMMVNKMDIRHNNCDPRDAKDYNAKFDKLSKTDKEKWYDLIYEQGLALYVLLEQQERNKKIDDFFKLSS